MKKPETVWVRNNGTEAFASRYDGEDFTIPPGGYVEMLVDCATLCLAFGEDDKERALRRLGWANNHDQMKIGEKKLAAFSFHMREEEARGGKTTNIKARSAAPAGGDNPSTPASVDVEGESHSDGERPMNSVLDKLARAASHAAG